MIFVIDWNNNLFINFSFSNYQVYRIFQEKFKEKKEKKVVVLSTFNSYV